MDFMENLKKAVTDTAQTAVKKTEKFVDDSKTKYSIYDLKNDIEKLYTEIGNEVYRSYKADENISEFIESKCAEIDSLNEKIEELKNKL